MKIGFIIPILDEYDIEKAHDNIEKACKDSKVDYQIIFALSSKLISLFTKIRNTFVENDKVKAFMTDRPVNEHKLIAVAMQYCEKINATIIYSAKENINVDVVKAFINSYQAGNKIVYLRKIYRGYKKFFNFIKTFFYRLGIKMLGIFKDVYAENDIQLLDKDVVTTINQLPNKNQMLRTLDSLIYYQTDVIHLEVDPKEEVDPIYIDKGKSFIRNGLIAYFGVFISIVSILLSFIFLGVGNTSWILHLILWTTFVIGLVVYILYNTRKILSVRVGSEIDVNEIKHIKEKTEFYNF